MNWAKEENGVLKYPSENEFYGVSNWRSHDKLLRMKGYVPMRGDAPSREGYAAVPKTWHVVEQDVASYIQVDEWDYVPLPEPEPEVVRYSKYKIQLACQSRGLWERVKEKIAAAGLQDSWSNIVDMASDNPELLVALPAIKEFFGADVVDAVLAESIAE
ncbi:MAG: hypothetical protein IJS15_02005 [Victivallales bacterium]|nr:hypothetical protein [Victivallales bacterium]